MNFKGLEIRNDYGKLDCKVIRDFENVFNIKFPPLYDDPIYGYPNVYSFGGTGNGDFVCFDYRDNPNGNEPKVCIVIHDEYDDITGKNLLFPIANSFEEFLDGLFDFDERYPDDLDLTE